MRQYLDLLEKISFNGVAKGDRTGTGTFSLFGEHLKFDLQQGFPLLTTKKIFFKSVVTELLWFLRGDTSLDFLHEHGCTIWDNWADEDGQLGPVYGAQWRAWRGIDENFDELFVDQMQILVDGIKKNPDSRRHIVSAWNVLEIESMKLPPCHCFFQCYVRNNELDLHLYQRSADVFIGVPFNIASYALLLSMLAQVCGYKPRFLHISFGDVHIYSNHLKQVQEQCLREPKTLPTIKLNPEVKDIFSFTHSDIELLGYDPMPHIKAEIAV